MAPTGVYVSARAGLVGSGRHVGGMWEAELAGKLSRVCSYGRLRRHRTCFLGESSGGFTTQGKDRVGGFMVAAVVDPGAEKLAAGRAIKGVSPVPFRCVPRDRRRAFAVAVPSARCALPTAFLPSVVRLGLRWVLEDEGVRVTSPPPAFLALSGSCPEGRGFRSCQPKSFAGVFFFFRSIRATP